MRVRVWTRGLRSEVRVRFKVRVNVRDEGRVQGEGVRGWGEGYFCTRSTVRRVRVVPQTQPAKVRHRAGTQIVVSKVQRA